MIFDVVRLLRSLVALFIPARQHALALAYIEVVAPSAVNSYRLQAERIAAVDQPWCEQHRAIIVHVEPRQIPKHIYGDVRAVAFHPEIFYGNAVHDVLFPHVDCGLRFRCRNHAQKG